jgi:lipoprotein-anchoring transpeptidase ErfK/SrfK
MPKGPLQIVVSIANQHVTLYSNGIQVAQGEVSTGIPDKPTPTGVFSIIQKDRFHRSNLYSNAPMPYMERITWSGVALHEGPLPGYPASHGCIRMTHDFAARLWAVARLGVRVIIAHNEVVPVEFSHPNLFDPKAKPAEPPSTEGEAAPRLPPPDQVRLAQAVVAPPSAPNTPVLRGAVEAGSSGAQGAPVRAAAADASPAATETKPAAPDPAKPVPDAIDPGKPPPALTLPKSAAGEQPAKRSGQVAVLISRKEGHLYVRQGFAPLFDMPIEIDRPEQPLGTHVFTALGLTEDGSAMRWNAMTIPGPLPRAIAPKVGPKGNAAARPTEVFAPSNAAQALDRIKIPEEAASRIDEILISGSSLVISDQGPGPETGEGTEFIVLTR